jgi:transcriptional regulator with XRE-family HTH domain
MSMQQMTPDIDLTDRIPVDRFGVRIAIIRAEKGWNYEQAGAACGVDAQSWRLWERTERQPRKYEEVCSQIARGAGYSASWIKAGGELRSRCFSPLTLIHGGKDGHLFDPDTFAPAVEVSPERPTLTLVQG